MEKMGKMQLMTVRTLSVLQCDAEVKVVILCVNEGRDESLERVADSPALCQPSVTEAE
jgi:hypothetical protein